MRSACNATPFVVAVLHLSQYHSPEVSSPVIPPGGWEGKAVPRLQSLEPVKAATQANPTFWRTHELAKLKLLNKMRSACNATPFVVAVLHLSQYHSPEV